MKGRRGLDPATQKLRGNAGKRRRKKPDETATVAAPPLAREDFFSSGRVPEPPIWLTDDGRRVWTEEILSVLERVILLPQGLQTFAMYCDALARMQRYTKALADKGDTYTTSTGFERARPEVDLRNRAFSDVCKLAAELNLTPKSWINSMSQYQARQLDLFAKRPGGAPAQPGSAEQPAMTATGSYSEFVNTRPHLN
jgi:P27 family predicted phage terminase small subunit